MKETERQTDRETDCDRERQTEREQERDRQRAAGRQTKSFSFINQTTTTVYHFHNCCIQTYHFHTHVTLVDLAADVIVPAPLSTLHL